jgi:glycosyltransferase involved in cell wall biosynthesis
MITVLRLDMLEQYKLAKQYGMEIDVITSGSEPRPETMCSRKYIGQCGLNERIVRSDMIKVLREYDIVTAYEFYGVLQKDIMWELNNFIPEVAWNVPTYGDHFGSPMYEHLALAKTKVNAFIAKSRSVYDCLVQEGIDESKIHLLNAPCDTERFKPRPKPEELKDKLVFLFIGRMQEQKGIFETFHAFKRAAIPNSKLIMIGPPHPTNPWELDILQRWITVNKVDVEILPYIKPEKIHEYYCYGDIFVSLPNTNLKFVEQIGLTIPQALASGLPVITNDFGGQIDYVDRTCGRLIPHKNYTKTAEAMREISEPKKLKIMKKKSRERAVKFFDLPTYMEKVRKVYQGIL